MRRFLLLSVLFLLMTGVVSAQTNGGLFTPIRDLNNPNLNQTPNPLAQQASFVRLNTTAFQDADTLDFNAFADLPLTFTRTRVEAHQLITDGYTWFGQADGVANGSVVISVGGGQMNAHILYHDEKITVRYIGDGVHLVERLPGTVGEITTDDTYHQDHDDEHSSNWNPPQLDAATINIDILVIYSTGAKTNIGGETAMLNGINTAIQNGNDAHVNTNTDIRYNVVHTAEMTGYNETLYTSSQVLGHMENQSDGLLDGFWALRNQYGADLVAFVGDVSDGWDPISETGTICGRANLLYGDVDPSGRETEAFSVNDTDCLTGFTVAHELGHNLGLQHDPANAGSPQLTGINYNFGYKEQDYYRTVMSYSCEQATPCTRVAMWSNETYNWNGRSMGTATQNNRNALNLTGVAVQYYRTCPADNSIYTVAAGDVNALLNAFEIAAGDFCSAQPITLTLSGGTYTFASVNNTTYGVGNNALPAITGQLVIDGGGTATLDLNDAMRLTLITSTGNLTLKNLTIVDGNSASNLGGAIYNLGTLNLENVTITSTTSSSGSGGGVLFNGGTMTIKQSLFNGNSASAGWGGVIYNSSSTTLHVENSTFSGNSTANGGAGIYSNANITLDFNTFYQNNASYGDSFQMGSSATATVRGNIFDDGTSYNCAGTVASTGYNIADDTSCSLSQTGDVSNVNPLLGALSGTTHEPQAGSQAIDAVPSGSCTVSVDARGVVRPQNGNCEMGAHEISVNDPDVNNDGIVSPADAIFVINRLGNTPTGGDAPADVNGDGSINTLDVQEVLNNLGL